MNLINLGLFMYIFTYVHVREVIAFPQSKNEREITEQEKLQSVGNMPVPGSAVADHSKNTSVLGPRLEKGVLVIGVAATMGSRLTGNQIKPTIGGRRDAIALIQNLDSTTPIHQEKKDSPASSIRRSKRDVLTLILAIAGVAIHLATQPSSSRNKREVPIISQNYVAVIDPIATQFAQLDNITSKLARNAIANKNAFKCDDAFCNGIGNATIIPELCSQDFCECTNNVAGQSKCSAFFVYVPINKVCDLLGNITNNPEG